MTGESRRRQLIVMVDGKAVGHAGYDQLRHLLEPQFDVHLVVDSEMQAYCADEQAAWGEQDYERYHAYVVAKDLEAAKQAAWSRDVTIVLSPDQHDLQRFMAALGASEKDVRELMKLPLSPPLTIKDFAPLVQAYHRPTTNQSKGAKHKHKRDRWRHIGGRP